MATELTEGVELAVPVVGVLVVVPELLPVVDAGITSTVPTERSFGLIFGFACSRFEIETPVVCEIPHSVSPDFTVYVVAVVVVPVVPVVVVEDGITNLVPTARSFALILGFACSMFEIENPVAYEILHRVSPDLTMYVVPVVVDGMISVMPTVNPFGFACSMLAIETPVA